ncbi:MAG: M56 family metallopeptidase [Acidobacteria bacterium]|nr:M56 family metallopeptidase [Acidobacteriota bacterium]
MTRLIAENLLLYSAQVAAIVAAAMAAALVLRTHPPRLRLWHWQTVLALCLALPLLEKWQRPEPVSSAVKVSLGPVAVVPSMPSAWPIPWEAALVSILALGAGLFLARLAAGGWRIRALVRGAAPVEGRRGAEFFVSREVSGPVTFGWRRPVILLPEQFLSLSGDQQDAVCAHELTHVRRRDWLFAVAEEIIRALLWFHPGVWYLLSRVQLAREQVVDQEVIRATEGRQAYVEALLVFAGWKPQPDIFPAPPLLRSRHLAERVAAILNMTRTRMLLSLSMSATSILIAGVLAGTLLPLRAPAQSETSSGKAEAQGEARPGTPRILHKVNAVYPPDAKLKRIEGKVDLEVTIDARGLVQDGRVLGGPDELRRAALQAVLQWQFEPTGTQVKANLEMEFHLRQEKVPPEQPVLGVLRRIEFAGVDGRLKARIEPRLPVKEGDTLTHEALAAIQQAVSEVDPNLRAVLSEDMVVEIMPAPMAIRVGGNVLAAKLTKQVRPAYPPLAKQAAMQGTVQLQVRIGRDGKVMDVQVISGEALLAQAAVEAVKQWEYATTLLNGNPVEVMTQVDVNFTLAR